MQLQIAYDEKPLNQGLVGKHFFTHHGTMEKNEGL